MWGSHFVTYVVVLHGRLQNTTESLNSTGRRGSSNGEMSGEKIVCLKIADQILQ